MTPVHAMAVAWILWIISWFAAAIWSAPSIKRPAPGRQGLYRIITLAGAFLLFIGFRHAGHLRERIWYLGKEVNWALVVLAVLGFLVTWWARLHLGRLWSSSVTKKADHHVVDTGPYAIVRHPIYTGIIVSVFATAILQAKPIGVVGAILMTLGFWIKARLEERFLREQLGADAYDSYRRKVPMLIPFGPKST